MLIYRNYAQDITEEKKYVESQFIHWFSANPGEKYEDSFLVFVSLIFLFVTHNLTKILIETLIRVKFSKLSECQRAGTAELSLVIDHGPRFIIGISSGTTG